MAAARQAFEVIDGQDIQCSPPAVVMLNPKYVVNVASMVRNCACFGIEYLILTGERLQLPTGRKGDRFPRQERLREFRTVKVVQDDWPMILFREDVVPIGVELTPTSMPSPLLDHPENGVYILGPEDGSISAGWRAICHHIIKIPTLHCLNLAVAGGIVLAERNVSLWRQGKKPLLELAEQRG